MQRKYGWRSGDGNGRSSLNPISEDSRFERARLNFRRGERKPKPQSWRKSDNPPRDKPSTTSTLAHIERLLEEPLDIVIQKLMGDNNFFVEISENPKPNKIVLIIKLLSRCCDCSFVKLRTEIMHKTLSSGFAKHLQTYIATFVFQSTAEKTENSKYWNDPDSFWKDLMKICTFSLRESPHFFVDNLLKVVQIFHLNLSSIETEHQINISGEIKDNLKSMLDIGEKIAARSHENKPSRNKSFLEEAEEEPPEDFRELSILPTVQELQNTSNTFLRRNVTIGSYKDVDHYLDVQFRLLKEDFVGPLRIAIQAYLSGRKLRDIEDVKIYQKVQFLKPVNATEDVCFLIQLNDRGNQEDSFMFGSLLCFTRDRFKSVLFGRIANSSERHMPELQKGQVVVAFSKNEEIVYNSNYTMVECGVYFEPYYHVLKVLQNIREEDFPMRRYLIDVDKIFSKPAYLQIFGDSPLMWLLEDFCEGLNESQNKAYKAALTRELSIIQGPPGTGKTYVGLKIAKTLLENSDIWWDKSPMLVVCFTNHALDQFLVGLLDTTQEMIRVGGQSKNPKLDQFKLKQPTVKKRFLSDAEENLLDAEKNFSDCLFSMNDVSKKLETVMRYDTILDIHDFGSFIPNYRESWLRKASKHDLLKWLLPQSVEDVALDVVEPSLSQVYDEDDCESTDSDEAENVDECIANLLLKYDDSFLSLRILRNEISRNSHQLNEVKQKVIDDDAFSSELIKLIRIGRKLKATYEFAERKLKAAADGRIETREVDIRESQNIPVEERWDLYFNWLNLYRHKLLDRSDKLVVEYRRLFEWRKEVREVANIEVMKSMKVIGMTTTCAARLHSSLQLLGSPIVIVEEAAEVLEAHVVSALSKSCQQLILIGDHQQLRPNTANYELEKHYGLGISLFERMVRNDVQCFTLDVQHRMKPEISALIKPTIYPDLKDHESVSKRPTIQGVEKCLFFIDHQFPEESEGGSSKRNVHEAKFLVQLANYLIYNGYQSDQVTILSAYLGQMYEIMKEKKFIKNLENVKVSVLDNYQGEENDIILLSLVRNNEENRIGFLVNENRVCVALSRARNGLYIMGNMTLLCNRSPLWVKIKETFVSQEAIGPALELKCFNHGKITKVVTAEDFSLVPRGGCDQICQYAFECGHKCKLHCHFIDKDHIKMGCPEICNRPLCSNAEHLCKKKCSDTCGPCEYTKNVTLQCGHAVEIQCFVNATKYNCLVEVETTLPCGHSALKPCSKKAASFSCQVLCEAKLHCGHSCPRSCHVSSYPSHWDYKCMERCVKFRVGCTNLKDEAHKCLRMCFARCEPCLIIVKKGRTECPHFYDVPCSENVDKIVCAKPCTKILDCGHKCKDACGKPCTSCRFKIAKQVPGCNHILKLPCNVDADRKLCRRKCLRVMPCGHVCELLCKEDCNCTKMVEASILAKCGHIVKEVPCFMKTLHENGVTPIENLESYCKEPCEALLDCGHPCTGSCLTCHQGRIHKSCQAKCDRLLICDHQCPGICSDPCGPCSQKCRYKCRHGVCDELCGDPCRKCLNPCDRACKHQKCRKLCGDPCYLPPCKEPCDQTLKCGHPCIGFCGDPCPPLCRVCDKEDFQFAWNGWKEGARFVVLNDCKHEVESSGMETWLEEDEETVGFRECPKCGIRILTTERYRDEIKRSFKDISIAKVRTGMGRFRKVHPKYSKIELSDLNNSSMFKIQQHRK